MKNAKVWLCATVVVAGLAGATIMSGTAPKAEAAAPEASHWRFHDGRWSFWHEGDKRWYYTDGAHWFYNEGKAWKLYTFDRVFGRGEGFVHGEYKVPVEREREKIIVPRHGIFHPG
jgi:hypothetical protein